MGGDDKPAGGIGKRFGKFGIKIFVAGVFGNSSNLDGETRKVAIVDFN